MQTYARRPWWHYAVVIAIACVAMFGVSLLSQPASTTQASQQATSATTMDSSSPSAAPSTSPTVSSSTSTGYDTQEQALAYLKSPARSAELETLTIKAGKLIARGLDEGKFGKVERYDMDKDPSKFSNKYTGWGGIETVDEHHTTFAWVWWTNGKIDYSKPIREIALGYAGQPGFTTSIMEPVGDYWTTTVSIDANRAYISAHVGFSYNASAAPTAVSTADYFVYPSRLDILKHVDDEAIRQLKLNMSLWFGDNWDK